MVKEIRYNVPKNAATSLGANLLTSHHPGLVQEADSYSPETNLHKIHNLFTGCSKIYSKH